MSVFNFKHFQIHQKNAALKVGTDSMLLGSLCNWKNPKLLLDIGTGTGVLSLMCAQRFSFEKITGIELSEEAFTDAQINAQNNPFPSKISILNQSIQDYKPAGEFDAIISNPPFFENSSKNPDADKSLARHTESLSFLELIQSIARLLSKDGKAWIIVPFESKEQLIQLAKANDLFVSDLITIFGKPDKATRVILSFEKKASELRISSLCIRTEDGSYTEEYKVLTKEFHDRSL
ncbi:MAG: methyltransferase small [Fluviicola sp.]|jgi:tRNA1Val (adenine37-N6)-methyltransferase|uniref:tRNA1(Val) (adenine(37)-N6)-methyltransferase n=1 Tax=Fluviicola sp. TaxID=1917219 RepID=UPI0026194B91|nr:methyltransferase [Fluviicola sp.]MDF3025872.1 methyltransferase small [Fluviicola sp.]